MMKGEGIELNRCRTREPGKVKQGPRLEPAAREKSEAKYDRCGRVAMAGSRTIVENST